MRMQCSACGLNVDDGVSYCPNCGTPIKADFQQASKKGQARNVCLWCGENKGFIQEEGKIDSKWGFTAHRVKLYICKNCGFVHTFGLGRTVFDFD